MLSALGLSWQAATLETQNTNQKRPIPAWLGFGLRLMGKLLSYTFFIAFIYDMYLLSPEATEFISKLFP